MDRNQRGQSGGHAASAAPSRSQSSSVLPPGGSDEVEAVVVAAEGPRAEWPGIQAVDRRRARPQRRRIGQVQAGLTRERGSSAPRRGGGSDADQPRGRHRRNRRAPSGPPPRERSHRAPPRGIGPSVVPRAARDRRRRDEVSRPGRTRTVERAPVRRTPTDASHARAARGSSRHSADARVPPAGGRGPRRRGPCRGGSGRSGGSRCRRGRRPRCPATGAVNAGSTAMTSASLPASSEPIDVAEAQRLGAAERAEAEPVERRQHPARLDPRHPPGVLHVEPGAHDREDREVRAAGHVRAEPQGQAGVDIPPQRHHPRGEEQVRDRAMRDPRPASRRGDPARGRTGGPRGPAPSARPGHRLGRRRRRNRSPRERAGRPRRSRRGPPTRASASTPRWRRPAPRTRAGARPCRRWRSAA